jgi:hypothetical protein
LRSNFTHAPNHGGYARRGWSRRRTRRGAPASARPCPPVRSVTEHTLLTADTASGWLTHSRDETGELRWRHELDKGPIGPTITFMDHGQQRIAVTSTAGVTVFGLDGK